MGDVAKQLASMGGVRSWNLRWSDHQASFLQVLSLVFQWGMISRVLPGISTWDLLSVEHRSLKTQRQGIIRSQSSWKSMSVGGCLDDSSVSKDSQKRKWFCIVPAAILILILRFLQRQDMQALNWNASEPYCIMCFSYRLFIPIYSTRSKS